MINVLMQFEQPLLKEGGGVVPEGAGIITCCQCWSRGYLWCCNN
jgi:hypothetical protein